MGSLSRRDNKRAIRNQVAYDKAERKQEARDARVVANTVIRIVAIITRQYGCRLIVSCEGRALDALIAYGALHGDTIRKDDARLYVAKALAELIEHGVVTRLTGKAGEFVLQVEPVSVGPIQEEESRDFFGEFEEADAFPPRMSTLINRWGGHPRQANKRRSRAA